MLENLILSIIVVIGLIFIYMVGCIIIWLLTISIFEPKTRLKKY